MTSSSQETCGATPVHLQAGLYLEPAGTYLPGIQRRWCIGSCFSPMLEQLCLLQGPVQKKELHKSHERSWVLGKLRLKEQVLQNP